MLTFLQSGGLMLSKFLLAQQGATLQPITIFPSIHTERILGVWASEDVCFFFWTIFSYCTTTDEHGYFNRRRFQIVHVVHREARSNCFHFSTIVVFTTHEIAKDKFGTSKIKIKTLSCIKKIIYKRLFSLRHLLAWIASWSHFFKFPSVQ